MWKRTDSILNSHCDQKWPWIKLWTGWCLSPFYCLFLHPWMIHPFSPPRSPPPNFLKSLGVSAPPPLFLFALFVWVPGKDTYSRCRSCSSLEMLLLRQALQTGLLILPYPTDFLLLLCLTWLPSNPRSVCSQGPGMDLSAILSFVMLAWFFVLWPNRTALIPSKPMTSLSCPKLWLVQCPLPETLFLAPSSVPHSFCRWKCREPTTEGLPRLFLIQVRCSS